MAKCYLVTSGEYSDYGVDGAFSSRENAQLWIDAHPRDDRPRFDIEELPLDPLVSELREGFRPYLVRMARNGDVSQVGTDEMPNGSPIDQGFDIHQNLFMWVLARDVQHAVKIVNEKRAQIIAENRWPEKPPPMTKEQKTNWEALEESYKRLGEKHLAEIESKRESDDEGGDLSSLEYKE